LSQLSHHSSNETKEEMNQNELEQQFVALVDDHKQMIIYINAKLYTFSEKENIKKDFFYICLLI